MDTVFEALLFLTFGLTGITIAVFVLAVSLLGRAIKISLQEQTKTAENIKKVTGEEIKKLQDKLEEAKLKGHVDVEKIRAELEALEKQQKKHKSKLFWIKNKPALLKVDGGVLLPGVFFIISIAICVLARYLLSQNPNSNVVWCLVLTIACIFLGTFILIQSLKVIEGVAITTEETSKEAYKAAIKEIEESKRPELNISFKNTKFPLRMPANTEIKLQVDFFISRADIAENVTTYFYIFPGFSFVKEVAYLAPHDFLYPDYVQVLWELPIAIKGTVYHKYLTIKSPLSKNTYSMFYNTVCKGVLPSEYKKVDIIVE